MPKKSVAISIFENLSNLALGALKNIASIEQRAEKAFKNQKIKLQHWLVKTVVLALSIFMSLVFFVLGLFFMAMDYGGLSRGVVFVSGGLLGLLFLGYKILTTE